MAMEMEPSAFGSSPRSRGAPLSINQWFPGYRIIPAFAGSTLCGRAPLCPSSDHPRVRGEHVCREPSRSRVPGSSPRSRGALKKLTQLDCAAGSSPRSRGAPLHDHQSATIGRIIPAFAGSTFMVDTTVRVPRDHPRVRGEHSSRQAPNPLADGSSPRSRGAHTSAGVPQKIPRIIPAFAGSTKIPASRQCVTRDHPRVRGEHTVQEFPVADTVGSSPRSRGAPASTSARSRGDADHPRVRGEHCGIAARHPSRRGIIPAFAGSTQIARNDRAAIWDHPRVRGEHLIRMLSAVSGTGSSPRSRGAPSSGYSPAPQSRIIPAFAGSTSGGNGMGSSLGDHPRVRGEHHVHAS